MGRGEGRQIREGNAGGCMGRWVGGWMCGVASGKAGERVKGLGALWDIRLPCTSWKILTSSGSMVLR